ncbi:MAG: hypothetical protein RLZZ328_264, partial [Bacteroidota bacterium]
MRTFKQILFIVALIVFTNSQVQASTVVLNSTETKSTTSSIAEKYS